MRTTNPATFATVAALLGFAANSILCRMALGSQAIDAWSFTLVRLAGGALMLSVIARSTSAGRTQPSGASFLSAAALFAYAAAFSLAYLRLGAGIGALVLFASVQATMIGWGVWCGQRPTRAEWLGLAIALGGLAWLTLPGAAAPDPIGLALMLAAGVAWGVYSLRGRASRSPLAATAGNFVRSVPMARAGFALSLPSAHASSRGIALALASGAIASGLGYTLWYRALPHLAPTRAALVQLVVPVLAAAAGVVWLGERVSVRLVVAGAMILGGVGVAVVRRRANPSVEAAAADPRTRVKTPSKSSG